MCDLCFVPRCDCEAALADSQTIEPNAAGGGTALANPAPTVTDALALDSTQHWTTGTVRYGFPDTAAGFTGGLSYYSPYNEPGARLPLSAFGRDSLRDGFAQWDAVTALTITEATSGTMAEINVGASSAPSTAWAYYPGSQTANGDIWFNTGKWFLDDLAGGSAPIIGSYAYATGMHEFGHALGLKHPHQASGGGNTVLDPAYDAVEFTIMSYRSYPGGPIGGYTVESWGYPQTPMMLDIAMIQEIYGADYTTQGGDTTYTVSAATGEFFVDGVSQGVPGANRVFRTIWDGDGTDHIDLSSYTTSMHADLNSGRGIRFDTDGNFQAARLASGVHAGFNLYMSLLHDGDTRSLIENLTTGTGDDMLIGNATGNVLASAGGNNTFTGGLGADRLVLGAGADTVTDTLAGLNGDTIVGFDIAMDRVLVQNVTPDMVTAVLAAGVLTLTLGTTVAEVIFEGLEATLDTVTLAQDGTALALVFSDPDDGDDGTDGQTDDAGTTPESLLADAIAAYAAAGREIVTASDAGETLNSGGGSGAVVQGGAGSDRLRENGGDDVMYGGAGPDQFVWDLRKRHAAEHDTVLDLDFSDGDKLRILTPDGQLWLGSDADLAAAVAASTLQAESTETGVLLRVTGFEARTLELAFQEDTPVDTELPDAGATPESLLADAIAAYAAAGREIVTASDAGETLNSGGGSGAVVQGGAGSDRLRENGGDDVMYGGAGPDQFVWDLRKRHAAEHDTVLDLDFSDGDKLRILTPDGQLWLGSDADLAAAVAASTLQAESTETGVLLRVTGFEARTLELAFQEDPFALA